MLRISNIAVGDVSIAVTSEVTKSVTRQTYVVMPSVRLLKTNSMLSDRAIQSFIYRSKAFLS